MANDRPIGRPTDPGLSNLYDSITKRPTEVAPEFAPKLRAITMATVDEMRRTRGDTAGNLGPRACILAGTTQPLDGGQAIYIWDPSSTATDDALTVVQVADQKIGRWRRATPLTGGSRVLVSRQDSAPSAWTAVAVNGDDSTVLGFEIVGFTDVVTTLRLRFLGSGANYFYTDERQNGGATTVGSTTTNLDTAVYFVAEGSFRIFIPVSSSALSPRRAFIESAEWDPGGGPAGADRDKFHRYNVRCTATGPITSIEVLVFSGSPTAGSLSIFKTLKG